MTKKKTRTINVGYLARVEGEGALFVKLDGDKVADVKLKIFEPPRFFEAFLRERNFSEAPDITARICGICPVAYQMSAVHAMEEICHTEIPPHIRELRRLLYCGEWIESHVLHIYMLHAPDFLGYQDAVGIAKDHPGVVERGLRLKKAGNRILQVLGGREIHPINVKVGGFYKLPHRSEMDDLAQELVEARHLALQTVHYVANLDFPDFEADYEFVSLVHPEEYPLNEGRIVSNCGLDIATGDYDQNFVEEHISYTNALVSKIKGRGAYLCGPMARFALNYDRLPQSVKNLAEEVGTTSCTNPFKSIVVRALEVFYACEEALRILKNYDDRLAASVTVAPQAGTGYSATEAPRGLLYHRYSIDKRGRITDAKIVPPTSQNQKRIEEDLWQLIPKHISKPEDELTHLCEQAIRNYDPCISCATHFLKLTVDHGVGRGADL